MTKSAVTLLYHDTVAHGAYASSGFPGADADHYKLPIEAFSAQLAKFEARRTECTLTFDDCGVSAVEQTASLLEQHGFRGVFFAPTDFIGKPGFCSPHDLRALSARGHEIGSHSRSHPIPMSSLTDAAMLEEWRDSRARLQDWTGLPIESASVPGGFYSHRLASAVVECGYRKLYTSTPRRAVDVVDGIEVIGRYCITRATGRRVIDALADGREWPWRAGLAAWQVKWLLKTIGGRAWFNVRRRAFALLAGESR